MGKKKRSGSINNATTANAGGLQTPLVLTEETPAKVSHGIATDPEAKAKVPIMSSAAGPPTRPPPMSEVNSGPSAEKTKAIMQKVDDTTKVMEANIHAATQRGESLNELQEKTQQISLSSKQFVKSTKQVKKNLWWKNMKFTVIIVFVVLILVAVVGLIVWRTIFPAN